MRRPKSVCAQTANEAGMSERIAVGVDAGGTSTVAALSRDGSYESVARGGPGNPSSQGVPAAVDAIAGVVRQLVEDTDPAALFVAAAGAGRESVREALIAALQAAFPTTVRIAVEDDARAALRAAIPSGPGVVLVAGTGSVAYGEHGDRRVRTGGAGYLLGDEGSGFAIGLAALKLLARTFDGRARADETTALAARAFAAEDRDALLSAIYAARLDVARVAGLAPSVIAFAGKGNRASTKIVQAAALELGDLIRSTVQQCGLAEASPTVAFAGGLLRENSLLSFLLETRVTNEVPGASVVRLRDDPARAALRFAEAL
jgi:N-acetylglucosamine kinase-like BadF-type ATPase